MKDMPPIVSYPKSGRTWLRYAAACADLHPEFTHAGHPTHIRDMPKPFAGIPDELKNKSVIFLHRNPLDTAVSMYFQILHKDCIPGRKTWRYMEERNKLPPIDIDSFVTNKSWGIRLICQYNQIWLKHLANDATSHVFTYEEFHAKPIHAFKDFFDALGHPEISARNIARRTSFENMWKIQRDGKGDVWRIRQSNKNDPESAKIRQGKVRGYTDYLKPTTIETCRRIAAKRGFTI